MMRTVNQNKLVIRQLRTAVIAVLCVLAVWYNHKDVPDYFKRYMVIGAAVMCALFIGVMFQQQLELLKKLAEEKTEGGVRGLVISVLAFLASIGVIAHQTYQLFF